MNIKAKLCPLTKTVYDMNNFFITGLLFLLISCQPSTDTKQASNGNVISSGQASDTLSPPGSIVETSVEPVRPPLKQYPDVSAMIAATGDYDKENGTFKIISQKPLHIQVSTLTYEGDLEQTIAEQVKRDIVFVGFRTFAQTDIDEIKITSYPLRGDNENKKDFDFIQKYKQTATLTRNKAKAVLEKYYGHTDFSKLFGETVDGTFMPEVPNMQIKRMMYNDMGKPTLDEVFIQIGRTSHNLQPDF